MAVSVSSTAAREQAGAVHLLDVPYIAQSEALCGGAAAAMVIRFWGATGVYAETFADLVDRAEGGIRTADLARALEARGWNTLAFAGDAALIQSHLLKRRPVIALIEDRPGRFHYVVIVGWTKGRVVLHDPAMAPFRVLEESVFVAAWRKADLWTMLVLPTDRTTSEAERAAADRGEAGSRDPVAVIAPELCGGLVREGVRLASTGALDESRRLLETAIDACPGAAAPWRELAGLRALRGEWNAAASGAREALRRDPSDEHAWRILATSRFLEGDLESALDAWNRVGEPLLDLVSVAGLDRTRYRVAADMLRLRTNALVTASDLKAARRRIGELPSAFVTRVTYIPGESGRARVDASVVERPVAPVSALQLLATALRAATDREVRPSFASVTHGGELWSAHWRWWERRPRVSLMLSAPAPWRLGTTWSIESYSETQTYRLAAGDVEETRRGAAFRILDWPAGDVRWYSEVGISRWRDDATAVTLEAGAARHLLADRAIGELAVMAATGDIRTWTASARGNWRSSTKHEGTVWLARIGYDAAGTSAPFALWSGAGAGQGRDLLLRAHPILDDGLVTASVLGRRVAHGGVEARRWFGMKTRPLKLAAAAFVDAAQARRGADFTDGRAHVDAGAGVRIGLTGAGMLRIDIARGLRDGKTAISLGWLR